MSKVFNVTAVCMPEQHYMVNLDSRLAEIKQLIDDGKYFTINKARQYGKTTTLMALEQYLKKDYYVVSMDFQTFGNENIFSATFARSFLRLLKKNSIPESEKLTQVISHIEKDIEKKGFELTELSIINGIGIYYIESRTRNMERTDVIVDYRGEQFVVELKVWRGNAYHTRGEKQLTDYLDYYHLDQGYMLSFNFNKEKEVGVHEISLGEKILIEAVV